MQASYCCTDHRWSGRDRPSNVQPRGAKHPRDCFGGRCIWSDDRLQPPHGKIHPGYVRRDLQRIQLCMENSAQAYEVGPARQCVTTDLYPSGYRSRMLAKNSTAPVAFCPATALASSLRRLGLGSSKSRLWVISVISA